VQVVLLCSGLMRSIRSSGRNSFCDELFRTSVFVLLARRRRWVAVGCVTEFALLLLRGVPARCVMGLKEVECCVHTLTPRGRVCEVP
jgi:hypothetical protein